MHQCSLELPTHPNYYEELFKDNQDFHFSEVIKFLKKEVLRNHVLTYFAGSHGMAAPGAHRHRASHKHEGYRAGFRKNLTFLSPKAHQDCWVSASHFEAQAFPPGLNWAH